MQSVSSLDLEKVVCAIRSVAGDAPALLHGPTFGGREWDYVKECVDTAWVSSAGAYVTEFERQTAAFTGAAHAVAVVNGTAALHVALLLSGVGRDDEVLAPALTFVATANAISYCGAVPHFVDASYDTLGLDPVKLAEHLETVAELRDGVCFNRQTGRRIAAVVPMHTFGHPVGLQGLSQVADRWGLTIVEDAAESLGSYSRGRHTGTTGRFGILSFNGNKIITTGAGGMLLTNDEELARRARHITTTAKVPHAWDYVHDELGFNYRMPNINAAIGCAQLEQLPAFIDRKRRLAERYAQAFEHVECVRLFTEPEGTKSNYWLNALVLDADCALARDDLLAALNEAKLQSRPIWRPMHNLPMYECCPRSDLTVTEDLTRRVINIPSSASLMPAHAAGGASR